MPIRGSGSRAACVVTTASQLSPGGTTSIAATSKAAFKNLGDVVQIDYEALTLPGLGFLLGGPLWEAVRVFQ